MNVASFNPAHAASTDLHQLAAETKQRARLLGFDLVGIASASPSKYREYYRNWLDTGQHGSMAYLAGRFEERTDPAVYLPGAQSVICLATNYHQKVDEHFGDQAVGKIAQYALGKDYHDVLSKRLHALSDWLRVEMPGASTKACVDTAPVLEKELAARAGIGWIGKNTCLINERIGSWTFLSEIITTIDFPLDDPATDRCGTCRRCIDACPTQAITAPYQLDARRCISYLTIEHRDAIDPALADKMGDWVYGCDVCQDVCPFNGRAPQNEDPAFASRFPDGVIDIPQLLAWRQEDFSRALSGSAMKRVKLPILQRNAGIVQENLQRKALQSL